MVGHGKTRTTLPHFSVRPDSPSDSQPAGGMKNFQRIYVIPQVRGRMLLRGKEKNLNVLHAPQPAANICGRRTNRPGLDLKPADKGACLMQNATENKALPQQFAQSPCRIAMMKKGCGQRLLHARVCLSEVSLASMSTA